MKAFCHIHRIGAGKKKIFYRVSPTSTTPLELIRVKSLAQGQVDRSFTLSTWESNQRTFSSWPNTIATRLEYPYFTVAPSTCKIMTSSCYFLYAFCLLIYLFHSAPGGSCLLQLLFFGLQLTGDKRNSSVCHSRPLLMFQLLCQQPGFRRCFSGQQAAIVTPLQCLNSQSTSISHPISLGTKIMGHYFPRCSFEQPV